MLDLNFVRENLDAVREALRARYFPTDALDRFVEQDAERRRIIAELLEATRERLDDNDGHGFFEALGDSVVTGPTLTNVNDFRAIVIDGQSTGDTR